MTSNDQKKFDLKTCLPYSALQADKMQKQVLSKVSWKHGGKYGTTEDTERKYMF